MKKKNINSVISDGIKVHGKIEERMRIIGMIEYVRDQMGDSTYEKYAYKKLNEVIAIIEYNPIHELKEFDRI